MISDKGYGQYTFQIPPINRKGKHDSFEEPLRRTLKKANKQLRETKSFYCDDNSFTGYVVIAQTGLISISTEITIHLVAKILSNEFSAIDGVIVCMPHSIHVDPITKIISYPCMSLTKDNKCGQIAEAWCNFMQQGGHFTDMK